jgi:hypothetical protein
LPKEIKCSVQSKAWLGALEARETKIQMLHSQPFSQMRGKKRNERVRVPVVLYVVAKRYRNYSAELIWTQQIGIALSTS